MRTYDVVLWQTGRWPGAQPPPLSAENTADLRAYIDTGGALFLTGQQVLDHAGVDLLFTSSYLGVASWTLDLDYVAMTGVAGDPIGTGMRLDLDLSPPHNAADGATPRPLATAFLHTPGGEPAGIRNETASGGRVVFLPWAMDALRAETNPDNLATLGRRGIEWLMGRAPSGIADEKPAVASGIAGVRPNPARGPVEIEILVSDSSARHPVRLEVFDLGGRRAATLKEGSLSPGAHVFSWSHRAADGSHVKSGVYFARLRTSEGESRRKIIVLH
jgi:hypothetical protein